jgi:hypothetical protein
MSKKQNTKKQKMQEQLKKPPKYWYYPDDPDAVLSIGEFTGEFGVAVLRIDGIIDGSKSDGGMFIEFNFITNRFICVYTDEFGRSIIYHGNIDISQRAADLSNKISTDVITLNYVNTVDESKTLVPLNHPFQITSGFRICAADMKKNVMRNGKVVCINRCGFRFTFDEPISPSGRITQFHMFWGGL